MSINLDTTQPDEVIPLNLDESKPVVPPTVAATRSAKAAYGLDGMLTYDEIYNSISTGNEDSARQLAAAKVASKKRQDLAGFILQTDLPADKIAAKFNSNPGSVFEDEYASKFYDGFLNYPGGNVEDSAGGTFSQAAKENPEGVAKVLDINKDLLSFRELVHNRYIDAVNAQGQQSYGGRAVDFLKDISGYTNLYTLRQNGKFWLEDQRQAFAHMDHQDRVETFNKTMDYLIEHNPGAAITYADYMGDPSYLKSIGDIAFTALDAAAVASAVGKGAKGLHGVLFQREVKRMADEVLARSPLADGTAPIKAVAEDAVGHPVEAGKVRMEAEALKDLQGAADPTQQMVDGITAALRPTGNIHAESPTNVGAEAMNRLRESFTLAGQNVVDTVMKMSRVLRVNETLASKAVMDKAYQEVVDRYPGTAGNVVGLMPIKHEKISNKLTVDTILMRNDATPFGSVAEAAAWAKQNGVVINNVHGVPTGTAPTGASIKPIKSDLAHPGQTKSLEDLLAISARDPNIGYKEKEGLERLGKIASGEPVETNTLTYMTEFGPRTSTAYRPAGVFSQGKGFYIAITRPLDETQPFFRAAITQTAKALDKNTGLLNRIGLGGWRTGSEVLSVKDMTDRQVSVYGPALLKEVIARIEAPAALARSKLRGQNIYDVLSNWKEGKQFQEMLLDSQKMQKDFKDVTDLNQYYLTKFDRLPSETEVQGYFSYIQGKKIDYTFRNLALHTSMSRVGGEQHQLVRTLKDGTTSKSKSFVAVARKEMSATDDNVLIQEGDGFKVRRLDNYLGSKDGAEANEAVKKGELQFSEVYGPDHGLNEFSGETRPIHFVLSKRMDRRPLDFIQLPEKEGGHLEYPYEFYLKEAQMQSDQESGGFINHYYKGDTTIMALESRAVGKDAQKYVDIIKAAWRAGDMDAAQRAAAHLGIGWPEIVRKFKSGALDPNQPTHIVPRGKTVADVYDFDSLNVPGVSKFKDTTRGGAGYLANQFKVDFTGERDAYDVFAMHNEGTIWNPALSYRPADTVDPFTSINRSLTRIVDSTYMQDVKIASVEGWVQRAKGLLNATAQEIRDNPYAVFRSAEFKRGLTNTAEVNQLEAERYQIKAFSGIPSSLDSWLHSISQSLQDSIYGGNNALTRAAAQVGKWSWDGAVAFPSFMRSVTYRADIGLFNPAQLLVQMNTYVTIAGISGFGKAGQGAFGALLHLYSKMPQVNEGILEGLDKMAQKVGYRPGEWLELRKHLADSGFEYVGKETNQIMSDAHMYSDKIYTSTKGNFLDAGEIFFKGGERFSRYGAWFTSGKEWRDVNPTKSLSLAERNSILNRADDLMGNMTKASRSALQTGLLSAPSQFLGYQLRVMELMLGKRLTVGQKARMYAVYGGAYGLPVAAGLQSVFPFTESIKRYAMEHGYVENENMIVDTAFQGLPAMLLKLISGNWYDVGERYGSPGFNVINDALAGDKSFWQVASGASGNLVMDTWKKMDPFYKMAVSHVKGDNVFNMTGADLVQIAKGINIVKTGWQVSTALNSMEWLSKNENPLLEGVSPAQAYFMGITGLQPLALSKSQQYYQAHQNQEEKEKTAEQGYVLEWRRGLRDLRNNDPSSATQHFRNADATLVFYGYPNARRDALFAKANDRQTLPEKEAWNYWVGGKDIPPGEAQYRSQVYGRILRSQQKEK